MIKPNRLKGLAIFMIIFMNDQMTIIDIFVLAGVLQGVLVGFSLLFTNYLKNKPNQYLGSALLVLVIITFLGWLEFESTVLDITQSIMWELLFPVLFFNYFVLSLRHRFQDKPWRKYLYLPFVLSVFNLIIIELSFRFDLYELPFNEGSHIIHAYKNIEYNVAFFYGIALILWSGKLLSSDNLKTNKRIKWLRGLFLSILSLYIIWLIADVAESMLEKDIWLLLWSCLSILFLSVLYFGILQLRLIDQRIEISNLLGKKKKSNQINEQRKTNFDDRIQQLRHLMEEDKLFRDPNLTRDAVAEKMNMSNSYLSQVIKETQGISFVDFINLHRVDAAKEMLSDAQFNKFTLQAIGIEAGFKSRSAFYSTFQKFTGKTPGEYKSVTKMS